MNEDIKARLSEQLTMSKFASRNDLYAEMNKQRCDARQHIEQLERELAEARKDAERYRWLRSSSHNQFVNPIVVSQEIVMKDGKADRMRYIGPLFGNSLDVAIDAAMKDKP